MGQVAGRRRLLRGRRGACRAEAAGPGPARRPAFRPCGPGTPHAGVGREGHCLEAGHIFTHRGGDAPAPAPTQAGPARCAGGRAVTCARRRGASSHARGPSQRRRTRLPQPRRTSAGAAHPAAECGHAPHRSQPAGASGLGPRGWGPSAPPAVSEESGERTAALPCRPGPRSRWQVCPHSLPASLLRREGSPPEGRPAPTLAGAAAAPLLAGACPSPAVPVSATLGGCELATSAQEE